MFQTHEWTTLDVPDIDFLPKPVFLRAQNLAAREVFPVHTHAWNQFVYATSGTLVVTVAGAWHVITPEQAIWVPTGTPHCTGALNGAQFRNLYVASTPNLAMPNACTVYAVSSLMRQLILELELAHEKSESDIYIDKLHDMLLEQLQRLTPQNFQLPWPQSAALRKICESLHGNPADPRSMEDWASLLGTSGRTLTRRFEKETGISVREWRHRLRLFLALDWLCAGRSITEIAIDLGYASTSAFTYMFHQAMHCTPTEWRKR